MQVTKAAFGLIALTLGAGVAPAMAATPSVLLQNSESFALDNYVRAFRVPVIGTDGKTKYYDVTIQLQLNSLGVPSAAAVTSAVSPSVTTGVVAPGAYKAGATTCVVTNMTLTNGRIQSFLTCTTNSYVGTISVATGPISAGHPFVTELHKFGEDARSDTATFTWGLDTSNFPSIANCSFAVGYPVGVKTNGSQLIASSFYNNTGAFACSASLTKQ